MIKDTKESFFAKYPNCTPKEMADAIGIHYNTARRFLISMGVDFKSGRSHNQYVKTREDEKLRRLDSPFDHYAVSQYGTVVHIESEHVLAQRLNDKGYLVVDLSGQNDLRKTARVHLLVASKFVHNPDPVNLIEVNHIDCDKTNPVATNLEYVTHAENMIHAAQNKLLPFQKLIPEQVHEICKLLEQRYANKITITNREIGAKFDVPKTTIERISCKKTWVHISKDYKF